MGPTGVSVGVFSRLVNSWKRVHTIVGIAMPGHLGTGGIRTVDDHDLGSKPLNSFSPWSLLQFLPSSSSTMNYKMEN